MGVHYPNSVFVDADDPAVVKAMAMYDNDLDDTERRNVFETMIMAVVSAERDNYTGDHLTDFAKSMVMTVRMNAVPGYRDAVRAARNRPPARYEDGVDVSEMLAEFGVGGDSR